MPFRRSSTSSRGMRLSSSSSSIVNRGQSFEYEQQAPQELQAPIGRHVWDLCGTILLPRALAWRSGHVESGPRNCRIRTVMRALPSVTARMRRPRGSSSSAAVRATTALTSVVGDPRNRVRSSPIPHANLRPCSWRDHFRGSIGLRQRSSAVSRARWQIA
jgi:hypothetical protein